MSTDLQALTEVKGFQGSMGRVATALRQLGIENQAMEQTAAALQMLSGAGEIYKGLTVAWTAIEAAQSARAAAEIAKWGLGAAAVGAVAFAAGYAVGEIADRYGDQISESFSGDYSGPAGQRLLMSQSRRA